MDDKELEILDEFHDKRAVLRNYVERQLAEAKLHDIEATKCRSKAKLGIDELNEGFPFEDK